MRERDRVDQFVKCLLPKNEYLCSTYTPTCEQAHSCTRTHIQTQHYVPKSPALGRQTEETEFTV